MDHSADHVLDVFSTLYRYHLDKYLCDLIIATPNGAEVHAHSVVLSAVCFILHSFKCTRKLFVLLQKWMITNILL